MFYDTLESLKSDSRTSTGIILAVLALLAVLLRLPAYYEPLERDLTNHAVIAHELLNGRSLYSDIWNHKPPLIYMTYASAEWVAGYGPQAVFLLNILAALATLGGVYVAATALAGTRRGGLWAAALWVPAGVYVPLQANQPNTEVFINASLVWAFALVVRQPQRLEWGAVLASGLLFAAASLYKPVAVVMPFCLALVYFLLPPAAQGRGRAALHIGTWALAGACVWFGLFAYFAWVGRFEDFFQAVFEYNYFYAGRGSGVEYAPTSLAGNFATLLDIRWMFPDYFALAAPLGIPALAALVWNRRNRAWGLLAAYALAVPVMILLPGKFYPHYYQLWLPVLVIATGAGLSLLPACCGGARRYPEYLGGAVLAGLLVYLQLPFWQMSPAALSHHKYEGIVFLLSEQLGTEIGSLLETDERLFQWGDESGLLFYSRRRPAAGVFFNRPMLHGPLRDTLFQRTFRQLRADPPELFVTSTQPPGPNSVRPLFEWLLREYRPFPDNARRHDLFQFWMRRGGKLEARRLGEKDEQREKRLKNEN